MMKSDSFWERLFYSQKPFRPGGYLGMGYLFGYAGFGCLVTGIIGDALNVVPGLEPVSWFLLGIGCLVLGLWFWLEWSHIRKEK